MANTIQEWSKYADTSDWIVYGSTSSGNYSTATKTVNSYTRPTKTGTLIFDNVALKGLLLSNPNCVITKISISQHLTGNSAVDNAPCIVEINDLREGALQTIRKIETVPGCAKKSALSPGGKDFVNGGGTLTSTWDNLNIPMGSLIYGNRYIATEQYVMTSGLLSGSRTESNVQLTIEYTIPISLMFYLNPIDYLNGNVAEWDTDYFDTIVTKQVTLSSSSDITNFRNYFPTTAEMQEFVDYGYEFKGWIDKTNDANIIYSSLSSIEEPKGDRWYAAVIDPIPISIGTDIKGFGRVLANKTSFIINDYATITVEPYSGFVLGEVKFNGSLVTPDANGSFSIKITEIFDNVVDVEFKMAEAEMYFEFNGETITDSNRDELALTKGDYYFIKVKLKPLFKYI